MKPLLLFLISLCAISPGYSQTPKYSIANGEYQNFILDNTTQTLYGLGTGGNGIGTNTGNIGWPIPCQFPSANTKIKFAAAGLHTGACIDVNGNVFFTGYNEDGTMGNGTTSGQAKGFVQITTDSLGNPFNNMTYLAMASSIFSGGAGYGAIIYGIKADGTLWVWGNTQGGYRGDGTYGRVNTRPVQVTSFPAGTKIVKVLVQNIAIALDDAGNVWTWGGNGGNNVLLGNMSQPDYTHPQKLPLPSPAKDIAGGGLFSYALLTNGSLYGWGLYQGYMGVGASAASGYAMTPKPILLDAQLNLPSPIAKISTNNTSTYVILQDGTMWAWGGNECGQIGSGKHLNYAAYTVNPAPLGGTLAPYAWNWDMSTAQFQQHKPVQIAPGINNFVALSEGVQAVFYKFAVDANGQLYSWGRNKYGVLANGVMDANYVNGNIGSIYPNSWDVPYVTAIYPFASGNKTIQSTSPYCLTHAGTSPCNIYSIPANTKPVVSAGPDQTITTSTANLDGSASSDNVTIVYYVWTQLSGPSNAVISIPSGAKAKLLGLTTGVYKFQLKCTDNGWMSDSSVVTITVNSSSSQPPVVSAGTDQTITLPTNSVTLAGSASEVGGTIASYKWVQLSGPSPATFGSGTLAQTTADNLTAGTYKFQLTVKDALGVTVTASVQVIVKPAVGPPVANAGTNQIITLPANSVTLTGSGSEVNGSISSYAWSQVSGPSPATIATAGQSSTGVSNLAEGVYRFQLQIKDAAGVTATATVQVTVNPAPGPPIANAGSSQNITLPTNTATLTGSGSETNGSISSYAWSQTGGPSTATITPNNQAQTTVGSLVAGIYRFQLTVKDANGVTATATVQVTVNPAPIVPGPPSANAGGDQNITLPISDVTLTGSGSETNGTIVSYAWAQTGGPSTATITPNNQAQTAISNLVAGIYTFQLTVKDNSGVTATDVVTVTVNPAVPIPGTPVANAGSPQNITLPTNSVTLTGSGSETNGTIDFYTWTQTAGPSTATITPNNQAQTTIGSLVAGIYRFQLTVKDNSGVSATASVQVTVNAAPVVPGPPSANGGSDPTITLPTSSVTLTGSGSETNGTIVSYAWAQTGGPVTATITPNNQAQTDITNLTTAGVYTFQLTVKDNSGVTATDVVTVTVKAAPVVPGPPSANGGADPTITLPANSVTLTGSGSESNGTIDFYAWTQTGGPVTATITPNNQAQTVITNLTVAGVYTFQLKVTDHSGISATDIVTVTVKAAPVVPGPPTADAGIDQILTLPTTLNLSGSGSETNGTIVSYTWTQMSGPAAASISTAGLAQTTVGGLIAGVYVFQLKVKDNSGVTATDQVQVTVNPAPVNTAPVANAGVDQKIDNPTTVTLDGSASYDTDGNIIKYNWIQISGLGGVSIAGSSTVTATVNGLQSGAYEFELTVTDDGGATATDRVIITVSASQAPLVVNAGTNDTLILPMNETMLKGSAVSANGTVETYTWDQTSGPAPAGILFSNAANTMATSLAAGTYIFQLTAKDDKGNQASSQVTIVVLPDTKRYVEDINLYPNPAHDVLNFKYTSDDNERLTVVILDAKGSKVMTSDFEKENTSITESLNITQLGRGVYYFVIMNAMGKKTARMFVKQ